MAAPQRGYVTSVTPTWLQESKLARPVAAPDRLPRDELVAAIGAIPVALLMAGPGAGKTGALLALLEASPVPDGVALWYSLDEADADPISCMQHLLAGMQQQIPGFGPELEVALRAPTPDPRAWWRGFFADLAAYNLPAFTLVLDDLHELADAAPDWVAGLGAALARLPARTRCFLATRRSLPLPVARLKAAGVVATAGPELLSFSPAEALAFWRARTAAPADAPLPPDLGALEGWPLGLHMRCVAGVARLGGAPSVQAYVTEELIRSQPAECRRFMLLAATLDTLDPATCDALFPDGEAARWLRHLEHGHFVERLTGEHGHRFPAYLREGLRAELPHELPPAERQAWHARAAGHFRQYGRPDLALPHLVGSRSWPEALQAFAESFPAMGAAGRYDAIERWLDALPPIVAAASGLVNLWRGHALARRGEAEAALACYETAQARCEAAGDAAGALTALLRRCTALAYDQAGVALAPLLVRAEALLPAGNDVDRADWLLIKVLLADQAGDAAAVRAYNTQVLALDDPGPEVASARWIARINLHTAHLQRGELDAARQHIEGAIDQAARASFGPYELFSRFLEAHLALTTGDVATADAFRRSLVPGWEQTLDWQDLASALTILGEIHHRRGDLKEAEAALTRSLTLFTRARHPLGRLLPLERLAWLAIARGQPARALALCDDAHASEPTFYGQALTMARGRALHLLGDHAGALALWEPLAEALATAEHRLLLARAQRYTAATLAGLGRRAEARARLALADSAIATQGYAFLLAPEEQLDDELRELSRRGGTARLTLPPAPAAPAPAAPLGDLEIRCLGAFEVHVGGTLITHWPRRKAKLALAALAMHARGLGVGTLAEVLGERSAHSDGLVRTNMTALRRNLEPTLAKGAASRYIASRDELYVLLDAALAHCDVREFEAAIHRGQSLLRAEPAAAATAFAAALEAYRGDLLADDNFGGAFEQERERYRRDAMAALRFLSAYQADQGDGAAAEALLRRGTQLAPTDEEPCLALVRHLVAEGQHERARQAYWDYRKALKRLLDVAPSPEFEASYRTATATLARQAPPWRG